MEVKSFSLNHLTESQFEEFCFDLLRSRGFINLKWKKGTGLSTSPSDRGRDIECQLEHTDIDGHKYFETWFVECKHSIKGVPPDKLQGALAWATSDRPDKLLLIASNFFSNPTHDFIANYEKNNRPHFKIKKWERTELESMTAGNTGLLTKYDISSELQFISIVHPAHLLYIKHMPLNSVDYFFEILDKLAPQKRDELLTWVYDTIIRPRYREPITGKETHNELRLDEVSYDVFKEKCQEFASYFEGSFLVSALVNFILQCSLSIGDTTSVDEKLTKFRSHIEFVEGMRKVHNGESNDEGHKIGLDYVVDSLKNQPPHLQGEVEEVFDRVKSMFQERIRDYPKDVKKYHAIYLYFCEHVVKELLVEKAVN